MQNSVLPMVWHGLAVCCLISSISTSAYAAPQLANQKPAKQNDASANPVKPGPIANVVAINRYEFKIPFTLKSEAEQIVEVLLFDSTDRGRTWQLHSRQNPSAKQFPYSCENDGEYWFAVRSQNRDGVMIPAGQLFPELKLTVDTRKPNLEFDVRPDAAGRVVGAWKANDANLDPGSLKIQYQNSSSGAWIDVPQVAPATASSVYQNQLAWWPETAGGQLAVRAEIRDRAGNATLVEREIAIPQVANLQRIRATPASNTSPMNTNPTQTAPMNTTSPTGNAIEPANQSAPGQDQVANAGYASHTRFASAEANLYGAVGYEAPPPQDGTASSQFQPMTPLPVPLNPNASQAQVWNSQVQNRPAPNQIVSGSTASQGFVPNNVDPMSSGQWRSQTADEAGSKNDMVVTEGSTLKRTADGFNRPLASTETKAPTNLASHLTNTNVQGDHQAGLNSVLSSGVYSGGANDANFNAEAIPGNARPINSNKFSLDYEIDAVGPSGVKDVVLWGTADGGRNWKSWSVDEDRISPFKVEVPQDGIYGFCIVISSNDGLRGNSPRPGDQADVWLRIDTIAPQAKIISAPFGEGTEVGKLIINWQAADDALALRPIDLAYSRRPTGPWTTIAQGLRNESSFIWKPELQTPDVVYIKLDARDMAGNVTSDITQSPVDISGLKPRGHIRDVRPIQSGE